MTTSGSTTTPASTDNFRVAVRIRPLLPIDNKIANYAAAVTDMEECESTEDSLEDNSAGGSGGGGGGGSARLVRPVDPKMLVFGEFFALILFP